MEQALNTVAVATSLVASARKLRRIERATQIDRSLLDEVGLRKVLLTLKRQTLRYYFMAPPRWRAQLRSVLDKQRMAPAFASIGAVRSGTSLLSDYIMQHPCVVLPLAKEIDSFILPARALLLAQFPSRREEAHVRRKYGMAVTGYCTPYAPGLAFPYLLNSIAPTAKIIVLLRDPVERAFAHWRWDEVVLRRFQRKHDPIWNNRPGFDEIVDFELEALAQHGIANFSITGMRGCGYLSHSIYLPFLKALERFYAPERVLLINANDFFADPAAVAKQTYAFLGLPAYEPVPMTVRNAGPRGRMSPSTQRRLQEFFAPLNRQLYDHVGRDFGWDRAASGDGSSVGHTVLDAAGSN